MKLDGEYLFEAPVAEVWSALFDPVVLAAVMPGCEKLELVEGQFVGDLNIKVGPVQGKFSGKVELKDVDQPKTYTMVIDGRGASGFVKATAGVKLEAEGAHTRMRYDADAQIGGKIASVGQRLLEASARAISKQSLEGLHENIKIRSEAAAQTKARTQAKAEAEAEAEAKAKAEVEARSAVEVAATQETPSEPPPPVLKKVDQKALAASVAREVTKSLLPTPVLIAVALGVVAVLLWLVLRTAG